jgi:hypothetical protein
MTDEPLNDPLAPALGRQTAPRGSKHGKITDGLPIKSSPRPLYTQLQRIKKPGAAKPAICRPWRLREVEDSGLEPLTFWLPARRSPN